MEALALRDNKAAGVDNFLCSNIMTKFGYPIELVSDQGTHFLNDALRELAQTHMILHKNSTPYHPQANGQVESSNKILGKIIKKL